MKSMQALQVTEEGTELLLGLFESKGEMAFVDPASPLVLDDPQSVWLAVSGGVRLFTGSLSQGEEWMQNEFCFDVPKGELLCGMPEMRGAFGCEFLAFSSERALLWRLPVELLKERCKEEDFRAALAPRAERWTSRFSQSAVRVLSRSGEPNLLLDADDSAERAFKISAGNDEIQLGCTHEVVWAKLLKGKFVFIGLEEVQVCDEGVLFPVCPSTWLESSGDISLTARTTLRAIEEERFWEGLAVFNSVIARCEGMNRSFRTADVSAGRGEPMPASLSEIGKSSVQFQEMFASGETARREKVKLAEAGMGSHPVWVAARWVGEANGIEVREPKKPERRRRAS